MLQVCTGIGRLSLKFLPVIFSLNLGSLGHMLDFHLWIYQVICSIFWSIGWLFDRYILHIYFRILDFGSESVCWHRLGYQIGTSFKKRHKRKRTWYYRSFKAIWWICQTCEFLFFVFMLLGQMFLKVRYCSALIKFAVRLQTL